VVFQGTMDTSPAVAVDTLTIAGLQTGGNRFEQCTIVGPTLGDALSIEGDAAQPGSGPAPENTIADCEIRGAEDKGIKVDFGGVAPAVTVRGSTFACNYAAGLCMNGGGQVCRVAGECEFNVCTAGSGAASGVGVALDQPCVGCELPAVDLGMAGGDAGRNALT